TLKKPTIAPIRPPWVYIIPEHIWGSSSCHDINTAKFFTDGQPMVGSGPFQLTGWDKGQNWTMTANPDYWGGAPHIDQFIVKKFSNAEDLVTALKTGTIDYSQSISVRLFDQLAKENGANGITTHIGPETTFDQMSFNMCDPTAAYTSTYCKSTGSTGNPALRDPVVRQAISWAIDRKTLVDKVLAGYGSPGTTVVPPFATTFHYDPPADQQYGFDINKANAMLDAAGYKDTDGDGIRNMKGGGANLDFRLILRSDSDISADLGQYISGWLSQIGIATKKSVLTDGKLEQAWLANDYDMYIWGWGPDPDPDFILSTFTSGQCGSWSDTCFSNKQYDQLYLAQQTAKTPEDRIKIVDQMQGILYQQVPEMVLMYDNSLEAYNSNKWTGLEDNISPQPEGSLWNQYTPYTALTIRPVGSGGSSSSGGISPIVWIGAIAIVGIGAAGFIASSKRRAKNEDDLA
ncbi:MAG TPA: ABC transporter substrate-binding protein, partial [Actinomycetota bacterium]|nr:ABC transporter substrate-binding protein [Actinomycetota bacterium]